MPAAACTTVWCARVRYTVMEPVETILAAIGDLGSAMVRVTPVDGASPVWLAAEAITSVHAGLDKRSTISPVHRDIAHRERSRTHDA